MKQLKTTKNADRKGAEVFSLRTSYRRYEDEKQSWIASHLDATPEQYTRAMLEIAKRCGV